MGVDYFHGVYAADVDISGSERTAKDIESVLRSYGLVDQPVSRWCLDAEGVREISDGQGSEVVRNVGVSFSSKSDKHAPIVNWLLGEAELVEGDEWAWADFFIVSGPDYRLVTEGESGPGVRIVQPSTVSGQELASFTPKQPNTNPRPRGWGHMAYGARAFDASTGCTAPVCEFDPFLNPRTGETSVRPDDFTGLWRTALLIQTKPYDWTWDINYDGSVLPESDFKTELWSALGGSAFELGYVW